MYLLVKPYRIMFIDRAELERRLKSEKNLSNQLKVRQEQPRVNTPQVKEPEKRALIGALSAQGVKTKEICENFDVTPQQVRSARKSPKEEVQNRIEDSLNSVRELALDKMLMALGLMTEDKFENANLKDLTAATANLSRVVERTNPRESATSGVQLIIYAPQQKSEQEFKTIDV